MRSLLPTALLLAAAPATASAATVTVVGEQVRYVAAPGEANRVLVAYAGDALSVTITDTGAPVTATGNCSPIDAHSAVCRALALPSSGPFLQRTVVELGDLEDHVTTTRPTPFPIGGVIADGGPGNDFLEGREGSDVLDGGGGRDTLRGGPDSDTLMDGDRDGATGDAGPGPDVLDGGDGSDTVSYAGRTNAVTVVAGTDGPGGEAGENDRIAAVESAIGGAGNDRLVGDGGENTLTGGRGEDVLLGKGADDFLTGGRGADTLRAGAGGDLLAGGGGIDVLACEAGADFVNGPAVGELMGAGCEQVAYSFGPEGEDSLRLSPHPTAASRRSVTFELRCPDLEELDGEPVACNGRIRLREATGRHRLLGSRTFRRGATDKPFSVTVPRKATGGRRVRVALTITARERTLRAGWDVRVTR
jgi:hypothetical protein